VKGKLVTLSSDRFDPSTLMANVCFPFSSQTGMGTKLVHANDRSPVV
jgi:hypothetical protein